MSQSHQITASETVPVEEMAALMRMPEIYWQAADALMPEPDAMGFEEHLVHPDVSTVGFSWDGQLFGYVQFNRRTTVGAEIHVGFHPAARGRIAKACVQEAIHRAFAHKGLLKLWAIIPSDNRRALYGARHLGFRQEGLLTKAMVRGGRMEQDCAPGVYDLVILGMSK